MMSSEELYFCETHQAGPWGIHETGSNGKSIYNFHVEKGCKVVKFVERQPTLKDGVKEIPNYSKPKQDRDNWRLEKMQEDGRGSLSEEIASYEMVRLLIGVKQIISKPNLRDELNDWCSQFGYNEVDVDKAIESVFERSDVFEDVKSIAFELGKKKIKVIFDSNQFIETSYWLMGRYNIKRVEVDGELLFFNDFYYERKGMELIKRESTKIMVDSTKNNRNEVVEYVKDACHLIKSNEIEKFVHLKCLLNGVYNIKTREFTDSFNPDYIILNQIPHNFDEKKTFENIDQKVSEIIIDKKDKQTFYDFLGTCLHPYTGIDFQFGGVGQPGTGKSQICDLVTLVFGEDNVSDASIHLIAKDNTTQIDVAYKFCNVDRDMSAQDIQQTDVIKKWITQDRFRARAIYQHSGDFRPTSRWLVMANDLYEIPNHDDAEAIYQRTYLVRMDQKFRNDDKEIKNVMEKVCTSEQLDGFITYLLKNSSQIYEIQNIHYPTNSKIVESIWNQFGNRISDFVKKWFVKGVGFKTEKTEVWDRWLAESLKSNLAAKGKNIFYKQFEEILGMTATKSRDGEIQGYFYHGIRLLQEDEIGLKETQKIDKL